MRKYYILLLVLIYVSSCDKILDLPSNNSFIINNDINKRKELLDSYVSSIYDDLYAIFNNEISSVPSNNLSIILSAFSDELNETRAFSQAITRNAFYNSYINDEGNNIPNFFTRFYKIIVRCNNLLDNFLTDDENIEYQLEIRAVRSILYFYLVQIYDEIPLLTSSDPDENFMQSRTEKENIYDFCINDLENIYKEIKDRNIKVDYSSTNYNYTERINRNVVAYYLSSFYLLNGNYNKSIEYSLYLINNFTFNIDYAKKFELSSTENIWILNPSVGVEMYIFNNANAVFLNYKLVPSSTPFTSGSRPFSLSDSLVLNMYDNDRRRIYFIDSVFDNGKWKFLSHKYKVTGRYDKDNLRERFVLLRLSGVYFNLIEAYYFINQKELSIKYFNEIGNNNYQGYEEVSDLSLDIIVDERKKEMFGELGDRWFTLKRTGLVDSVMNIFVPLKTNGLSNWNSADMLNLPIPIKERLANPNL